jgi:ribulose-phosphate 3-epimerase
MVKIHPSVMGKSQGEVGALFEKLEGVSKYLHLDVADGKFVPNTSLWFKFKLSKKFKYAVHLMVKDPKKWIIKNGGRVSVIIFNVEPVKDIHRVINLVRKKRKLVGLAIKPETSVRMIGEYLDLVDYVLVLTVHPGFYGAKYLKKPLEKIKQIKKLNSKIKVVVDGGMNLDTIKEAVKAGADIIVSGSFIAKSEDSRKAIEKLRIEANV